MFICFTGFGSIFTYMAALTTGIANFDAKYRGTVIGLLDAFFSAGPAIMAAIYGGCYVNGHVTDEENQNLGGFLLLSATLFAIVNALGIAFLATYPAHVTETSATGNTENGVPYLGEDDSVPIIPENVICAKGEISRDLTGFALCKNIDFQFLTWVMVFCAGLQLMFQANITTYLKSFNLERFSTVFTIIVPMSQTIFKLTNGALSDIIIDRVPRALLLLITNVLQTLILAVCIFFADQFTVLLISTLVIGMANGTLYCLTPTILSEFFGTKYFARNWGWILLSNGIGGLLFQQVYGALYDVSITKEGATDCYGLRCFTWSFVMAAVVSFCAVVLNVGVVERQHDRMKEAEISTPVRN